MVAKIETGKSLIGALNYNERKVEAGKATLIGANGYPKDSDELTFNEKLFRLTDLATRNLRTKTNTMHLSLNFDQSEVINDELLQQIAVDYMERLGWNNQPYLIYRHFDAGHPHIHIVTTNIQPDGRRLSMHNIGREKSEPARQAIEEIFNLVRAEASSVTPPMIIKAVDYMEGDLKRAITNVVNYTVANYKFTSLPEFNASLRQYHVKADRGSENTTMYKKGGLLYWALDQHGQKVGVPIKASSIYKKPTLRLLEARFKMNAISRQPFKDQVKEKIAIALRDATSTEAFKDALLKQNTDVLFRVNQEGRLYGITFIDQTSKSVFNGSDLGKQYSANAIAAYLDFQQNRSNKCQSKSIENISRSMQEPQTENSFNQENRIGLLEALMNVEQNENIPAELRRKRKKKRRLNL